MSGASEQANGRASGPVLTSRFMAVLNHSARLLGRRSDGGGKKRETVWRSRVHAHLGAGLQVPVAALVTRYNV